MEEDSYSFEGEEELPALRELMNKAGSSSGAESSFPTQEIRDVWLGYIAESNRNGRNDLREQIDM